MTTAAAQMPAGTETKPECKLCGVSAHAIQHHLKEAHPGYTIDQYREEFPDAPLLSDLAKKALERKRAQASEEAQRMSATVTAIGADETIAFHEAFDLPSTAKAAFTTDGRPIPITRFATDPDHSLRIPKVDDGYILNIPLAKVCLMAMSNQMPIYLYGEPGIGKSSIFKEICARTNRPWHRQQHMADTESAVITGQWVVEVEIDETTGSKINTMRFNPGPLPMAMRYGWTYVADEFDRGNPGVQSVYQAVLEGEPLIIPDAPPGWQVVEPHPRFCFVGTGNTNCAGDDTGLYQSALAQDAATVERFSVVEQVRHMDAKLEQSLIVSKLGPSMITPAFAKLIVDYCNKIRDGFPNEFSLTIGPRVMLSMARLGCMMGDFRRAAELSYINRLPENEREAAGQIAQRIFS